MFFFNENFLFWSMTQLNGLEQQVNLRISRCCNLNPPLPVSSPLFTAILPLHLDPKILRAGPYPAFVQAAIHKQLFAFSGRLTWPRTQSGGIKIKYIYIHVNFCRLLCKNILSLRYGKIWFWLRIDVIFAVKIRVQIVQSSLTHSISCYAKDNVSYRGVVFQWLQQIQTTAGLSFTSNTIGKHRQFLRFDPKRNWSFLIRCGLTLNHD